MPNRYANFVNRVDYVYADEARLVLTFGLLGISSNTLDCLLDLGAIWQQDDNPLDQSESLDIVNRVHERLGTAFEAIATDKARELFNAG